MVDCQAEMQQIQLTINPLFIKGEFESLKNENCTARMIQTCIRNGRKFPWRSQDFGDSFREGAQITLLSLQFCARRLPFFEHGLPMGACVHMSDQSREAWNKNSEAFQKFSSALAELKALGKFPTWRKFGDAVGMKGPLLHAYLSGKLQPTGERAIRFGVLEAELRGREPTALAQRWLELTGRDVASATLKAMAASNLSIAPLNEMLEILRPIYESEYQPPADIWRDMVLCRLTQKASDERLVKFQANNQVGSVTVTWDYRSAAWLKKRFFGGNYFTDYIRSILDPSPELRKNWLYGGKEARMKFQLCLIISADDHGEANADENTGKVRQHYADILRLAEELHKTFRDNVVGLDRLEVWVSDTLPPGGPDRWFRAGWDGCRGSLVDSPPGLAEFVERPGNERFLNAPHHWAECALEMSPEHIDRFLKSHKIEYRTPFLYPEPRDRGSRQPGWERLLLDTTNPSST